MDEPPAVNRTFNLNAGPGNDALEDLLVAGLANVDGTNAFRPQLAEAVPTVENGLWRVFPDGRMETTWNLRPDARWHDGSPFTSSDLLFTAKVGQDRELQIRRNPVYELIEAIEAPAPSIVTIRWKVPYIYADNVFNRGTAPPIPEHLLAQTYFGDKAGFEQLPYWTEEFVGAGPFKVREWVKGSHVLLAANEQYVLGKPKIDQLEVRFIRDANALSASLLAGVVEATLGRSLTLDPAIQVRDAWREGRLEVGFSAWFVTYPQLLSPTPSLLTDLQFRRALLHAVDRQLMVEHLQGGLTSAAHTRIHPSAPEYPEIAAQVPRYEYDPRRASQLLESLGLNKGPDGFFRGAQAQRIAVEVRATGGDDLTEKTMFFVADTWKRLGIDTEPFVVPVQLERDLEHRATFPGFTVVRQPNSPSSLDDFHSSAAPSAETRFQGRNRPRYMNAEFDALIGRFYTTIPKKERTQVLGEIEAHIADRLIMMGLYYNTEPTLISNRLVNVRARAEDSTHTWNAEQWDVR